MAKNKKAFVKTLEALLAIIITSIFMLGVFPKQQANLAFEEVSYLAKLEKNSDFRIFAGGNDGCFNSTPKASINVLIESYLPARYDYIFCSNAKAQQVPQGKLYADTLFFTGNITQTNYKILRLYYWVK
jgi:hypothetical protein